MYRAFIDFEKLKGSQNLIIVGGTHGAGKSSLCNELKSILNFPIISPQIIRQEFDEEIGVQEIYRTILNRCKQNLSLGNSFLFEHVMSGNFVGKLIKMALEENFIISLFYINIEHEIALDRIHQRVELGGHDRGEDATYKRLRESRKKFWDDYKILAHHWYLLDNNFELKVISCRNGERVDVMDQDKLERWKKGLNENI